MAGATKLLTFFDFIEIFRSNEDGPQSNMDSLIQYEFAILLMGATMCLFMALYFHIDSRPLQAPDRAPNKFLAGFMTVYGLAFVDGFLGVSDTIFLHPHLTGVLIPFFFLLGPFFYFYIRDSYDDEAYILDKKRYRHFIFPLLSIAFITPFLLLPESLKFALLMEDRNLPQTPHLLVSIGGIIAVYISLPVQILYYLVRSYRVLMQYFTDLKQFFANIDDHRLDWLRFLILMLSLQWLIYAYENLVGWPESWADSIEFATTVMDVAIVYFLSFKGLRQATLRQGEARITRPDNHAEDSRATTPKYAKSALQRDDAKRILAKLRKALETDGLYTNSMLSLRSLGDHTGISINYISQVINQELGCNFFDFVNKFRIEAAKRQLSHAPDRKIPVLEIAHAVGFNSKSTFNTAFKRYTGLTPTEYRKQQAPAE